MCFSILYSQYVFFRKEERNENFGLEIFFDPLIIEHYVQYSITAPELIMFNEHCSYLLLNTIPNFTGLRKSFLTSLNAKTDNIAKMHALVLT